MNEKVDRHHWLELSLRPACLVVTCDLTLHNRADRFRATHDESELHTPISLSYSAAGGEYTSCRLPSFVAVAPATATDWAL